MWSCSIHNNQNSPARVFLRAFFTSSGSCSRRNRNQSIRLDFRSAHLARTYWIDDACESRSESSYSEARLREHAVEVSNLKRFAAFDKTFQTWRGERIVRKSYAAAVKSSMMPQRFHGSDITIPNRQMMNCPEGRHCDKDGGRWTKRELEFPTCGKHNRANYGHTLNYGCGTRNRTC